MKITRRRLRKIIQEEKQRILLEAFPEAAQASLDKLEKALMTLGHVDQRKGKPMSVVTGGAGAMGGTSNDLDAYVGRNDTDKGVLVATVSDNGMISWGKNDIAKAARQQLGEGRNMKISKRQLRRIIREAGEYPGDAGINYQIMVELTINYEEEAVGGGDPETNRRTTVEKWGEAIKGDIIWPRLESALVDAWDETISAMADILYKDVADEWMQMDETEWPK